MAKFGLPTVLFLIFLVLKLTGHLAWSWWWVTAPLWIGAAIFLVVAVVVFVVTLLDNPVRRLSRVYAKKMSTKR